MSRKDKAAFYIDNSWRFTPARLAERISNGEFKRFPYIEYVSNRIAKTIVKGNGRLLISLPPRHGKSWLISKWTPAWYLSLFQKSRVILTSYEATFAATWGRVARNLIEEHSDLLRIKVCSDSHASDQWELTTGGGMYCTGVGGPIIGRGGDLIIIDDPIKNWEEANSQMNLHKQIEWFNGTLYHRCEPSATIIVLMTRWHEGDLVGYLSTEHTDKWEHIKLPAIAEQPDEMGRQVGQCLNPERFDEKTLENIRMAIGPRPWNGLYQQRPSAQEGNLFKRDWWKHYSEQFWDWDQIVDSWDLTFKKSEDSDFVVGQKWGRRGVDFYLIDQFREQIAFSGTLEAVRELYSSFETHGVLVEDKANGPAVMDVLEQEIPGIIPVEPDGSKEARAQSIAPLVQAGNVYLPDPADKPWVRDYIEEFANFPNGNHDDQVDATSQALRYLRGMVVEMPEGVRSIDR